MRRMRSVPTVLLALLAAFVLLPLFTGVPFVSYASSGSMEPTIGTFDVFMVNPWPIRISTGDIVVFDSAVKGEPAVHRVVGGDRHGWYTQGDANGVADQFTGEPLVTSDRILGRVVTLPSGEPLLIPDAGIAAAQLRVERVKLAEHIGGERNLLGLIFAILAVAAAVPAFSGRRAPPPARAVPSLALHRTLRRIFPRGILGRHVGLAVVFAILLSASWAASRASTEVEATMILVHDDGAADTVRATTPGGVLHKQLRVGSLGLLPTLVVVESATPRIDIPVPTARVGPMATTQVAYDHIGGEEKGVQVDGLHVWRYPALMPDSWTVALHGRMAGSPYVAIAGVFSGVAVAWLHVLGLTNMPVGRWLGLREGWR